MRQLRAWTFIPALLPSLVMTQLWILAGCSGTEPIDPTPTTIPTQSLTPNTNTPGTSTPGTSTPGTSTPGTSTPGTSTPGTSTPGTDTPGTDTPGTDTPGTSTPGTSTPPTQTPGPTQPPTSPPTPTVQPTGTPYPPGPDIDQDGYTTAQGDCDDFNPSRNPGAPDIPYDGQDQDCDGSDEVDVDEDGYAFDGLSGGTDCDDEDASINPGAEEIPYDEIDEDCDGFDLTDQDDDGYDGIPAGGTDCDDENSGTYPGAQEYADGNDNDCDGTIDNHLNTSDDDHDGYSEANGDCRDDNASVHPGAQEICNTVDDDCDGMTDANDPSATGVNTYYADSDRDNFGDAAASQTSCESTAPSGYVSNQDDCNDKSVSINPSATEVCNAVDDDCDKSVDEGVTTTYYLDADADGYGNPSKTTTACSVPAGYTTNNTDCKDSNDQVNPGAVESCNGIDDNCNGKTDEGVGTTWYRDADGDGFGTVSSTTQGCSQPTGYVSNALDCNDGNASIKPGASESCNGIDDNCDGTSDEGVSSTWYQDADADGYGNASVSTRACTQPSGYVSNSTDCNDTNAQVKPGATEICNSIDDDCDSVVDDGVKLTWYQDVDGDTYGNPSVSTSSCTRPTGYVSNNTDCNDALASVHPGATEICNSVDEDCDGLVDDGLSVTWYQDTDADGYGTPSVSTQACSKPSGYVNNATDCNDANNAINPAALETCNSVDDNCNNSIDEGVKTTYYQDADGDGFGNLSSSTQACTKPSGYVTNASDCNDANAAIKPGASEQCNGVDDDCDTVIDDGAKSTYYQDADADGFGNLSASTQACSQPTGYVTNASDCNDANPAVKPGATETCNGLDDDCDTVIDDGVKGTYYQDLDADTYGNPSASTQACTKPTGYTTNNADCDDTKSSVNPAAVETCNSLDDNCNGTVDENVKTTYYQDTDGDTYGNASVPTQACSKPTGYATNNTDCNDTNASIKPGATETCNGIDDNCSGVADEGVKITYYQDADGDTFGNASVSTQACAAPTGYVTSSTDCNDTNANINPGKTETQNGVDDNCNGSVDEGFAGFSTNWIQHTGMSKAMYTRCESVTNSGKTCNNPEIKYGTLAGGIPYQHSGNQLNTWCVQLGYTSNTAVTYGLRDVTAPKGRLFGCTSYDESAWHWCDWQDGYWYNQTLDYHSSDATGITSITCQ